MPPRANWKGYLKLSLVTCSVELFPATSDKEKVSFHLLNSATGHRLKQQYEATRNWPQSKSKAPTRSI
jgi:DNA end-binding protein Ku